MKQRVFAAIAIFIGLWLAGAALFAQFNYEFSYETLSKTVKPSESVRNGAVFLTLQVVALFLVLRPVSFNNSWLRVVAALAIGVAWFAYLAKGVMHAPGWFHANLWWLLAVITGLLLLGLSSGIEAFRSRGRVRGGV